MPGHPITGKRLFAARSLVILFLLISASSVGRIIVRANHANTQQRNEIEEYTKRFQSLKPLLPDHGVIGYAYVNNSSAADSVEGDHAYYMVQYILAPLVVDRATTHDYLIVDRQAASGSSTEIDGYVLMFDCKNGVFLYRGKSR